MRGWRGGKASIAPRFQTKCHGNGWVSDIKTTSDPNSHLYSFYYWWRGSARNNASNLEISTEVRLAFQLVEKFSLHSFRTRWQFLYSIQRYGKKTYTTPVKLRIIIISQSGSRRLLTRLRIWRWVWSLATISLATACSKTLKRQHHRY